MPRYASGQPIRLSTTVRDTTGTLVTPGSILLRLKKPDGTFVTPDYTSPTADSVGQYHQDIGVSDLPQTGSYQYAWITTGVAAGVSPAAGFQVVDPFAPTHLSFGDAKARLNVSSLSDDEIQDMIASAVAEQEQRVGAVAPRTVTEQVYAHYGRLSLSTRPVLAVTSATLGGVTQTTTTWRVPSAMSGLVELNTGAWWGGYGPTFSGQLYTVTYTAGRNPVPQDLVEAALLRVQHSYETQRGSADTAFTDQTEGGGGAAFLLILRAQDKEKPYVLPSVA